MPMFGIGDLQYVLAILDQANKQGLSCILKERENCHSRGKVTSSRTLLWFRNSVASSLSKAQASLQNMKGNPENSKTALTWNTSRSLSIHTYLERSSEDYHLYQPHALRKSSCVEASLHLFQMSLSKACFYHFRNHTSFDSEGMKLYRRLIIARFLGFKGQNVSFKKLIFQGIYLWHYFSHCWE